MNLLILASLYLCGAYTLEMGTPPIYKKSKPILDFSQPIDGEAAEHMHKIFVAGGLMIAALFLCSITGLDEFVLVLPAGCIYWGWSIRSKLKRETGGPLPWVAVYTASPLLFPLFDRRPMLLFDIWTLTVSGLFGLPIVAKALWN
ncbi:MAG: hypothetical protein AAGA50_23210 [Pseudomonadota bacterium]